MHRRQLLARVMTTGLVLVGGTRFLQAQRTGPISEAEIQILLQAKDEASEPLSGMPYFVGEHGPELFTPTASVGSPRTDIDYERLGRAIVRAMEGNDAPAAPTP